MNSITKHPLYSVADSFKKGFLLNGFALLDNGEAPELVSTEKEVTCFSETEEFSVEPLLLDNGTYMLRPEQISAHLNHLRGTLPVRCICCGNIYDNSDKNLPAHLRIEGIYAEKGITFKDYLYLWKNIVNSTYGITASCELEKNKNSYDIKVTINGSDSFIIGCTSPATWLARALLNTDAPDINTWIFTLDLDTIAMHISGYQDRAALYDNKFEHLTTLSDTTAAVGNNFACKVDNLLRSYGYHRFISKKIYPENCYRKMNMVQESWDANNKGIPIADCSEMHTFIPTVLTPALEDALSICYASGSEAVKIYDIAHIFLPGKNGNPPTEKIALSLGCYGNGICSKTFKDEIDHILADLGVQNHFFFPTDMAIAYDTSDTWLVLDEKLHYLESNFGGISDIAEKNHDIHVHCFMANLELNAIEKKHEEEFNFIPPELR